MKTFRLLSWFFLAILVLVVMVSLGFAQESPAADEGSRPPLLPAPLTAEPALNPGPAKITRETYTAGADHPGNLARLSAGQIAPLDFAIPDSDQAACQQLLANTQLDVVEFGDGGSAEPWVILDDFVYFSKESYVSPQYSLFLADFDEDDPSPTQDAFAQGFWMPDNLTKVTIEYQTGSLDANDGDPTFGDLWTLDQDGFLQDFLGSWTINPSENEWAARMVEISTSADLQLLQNRPLAIVFYNVTDNAFPDAWVFFDDIKVTACTKTSSSKGQVFLPTVLQMFGEPSGPVCQPPTEIPQDQYNANRGLVQTNAKCNSTLSNIDRADYYTFKPTKTGPHTLHLQDLPGGTEWSAMIFLDQANPDYAPGPITGQCRIATPGSVDKQVTCTLNKNTDYFVKVSAGSTYDGPKGNYLMQIVGP